MVVRVWALATATVILAVGGMFVMQTFRTRETRIENSLAITVDDLIKVQGTYRLVRRMPAGEGRYGPVFESGPLQGGSAVFLLNNDAAFWVHGGKVYVVNDAARALLPGQPSAPAAVTYDKVKAVVE